mmetsp:Transcript_39546/g.93089  ORF Transcript_39546/g.93089 Transcript_39546/m.93089 type:complete len:213 (+) Transcript_39546:293-931(+)
MRASNSAILGLPEMASNFASAALSPPAVVLGTAGSAANVYGLVLLVGWFPADVPGNKASKASLAKLLRPSVGLVTSEVPKDASRASLPAILSSSSGVGALRNASIAWYATERSCSVGTSARAAFNASLPTTFCSSSLASQAAASSAVAGSTSKAVEAASRVSAKVFAMSASLDSTPSTAAAARRHVPGVAGLTVSKTASSAYREMPRSSPSA